MSPCQACLVPALSLIIYIYIYLASFSFKIHFVSLFVDFLSLGLTEITAFCPYEDNLWIKGMLYSTSRSKK